MTLGTIHAGGSLTLRGKCIGDLEEVKRQMDAFSQLASAGDQFIVTVSMTLGRKSKSLNKEGMKILFSSYRRALKLKTNVELATYFGVSRTTLYNWLNGLPVKGSSFEMLLDKAPNEGIRAKVLDFMEGP